MTADSDRLLAAQAIFARCRTSAGTLIVRGWSFVFVLVMDSIRFCESSYQRRFAVMCDTALPIYVGTFVRLIVGSLAT